MSESQEEMKLRQRKFKAEADAVRARLASMPEIKKKNYDKFDQYAGELTFFCVHNSSYTSQAQAWISTANQIYMMNHPQWRSGVAWSYSLVSWDLWVSSFLRRIG